MSDEFRIGLTKAVTEHRRLLDRCAAEAGPALYAIARAICTSLSDGGKLLVFGNGGSAAQAQEVAAELVNRFTRERRALAAVALCTDGAILTSVGNDTTFVSVFARQVEAHGRAGDVALALSTRGRSPNVLAALRTARERGLVTAGLLGADGGEAAALCDSAFVVPSPDVARVQELHLLALHVICDYVERTAGPEPGPEPSPEP